MQGPEEWEGVRGTRRFPMRGPEEWEGVRGTRRFPVQGPEGREGVRGTRRFLAARGARSALHYDRACAVSTPPMPPPPEACP